MGLNSVRDGRVLNPLRAMGAGSFPSSKHRSQGGELRIPATRSRQPRAEQVLKRCGSEVEARLQRLEVDEMKRQLEEKKSMVRAALDKARIALSQQQGKSNAPGKFAQSKEFLDAVELLQCNKSFKLQPRVPLGNESANAAAVTPYPKLARRGSSRESSLGLGPRAVARLFTPGLDSRARTDHDRAPKSAERSNKLGSTTSRYLLPVATARAQAMKSPRDEIRSSSKSVIVEIKERLRRREQQQSGRQSEDSIVGRHEQWRESKDTAPEIVENGRKSGFWKAESAFATQTKSLSTGKRVSMMRPDMDDFDWTMSDGEVSFLTPKPPFTDPTTPVRAKATTTTTTTKSSTAPVACQSPRPGSASVTQIVTPRSSNRSKLDSPVATSKRNEPARSSLARCRSALNVDRVGYRTASPSESCEAVDENNVTPRSTTRSKLDSPVATSKRSEPARSSPACCRPVPNTGHRTASPSESCEAVNENNVTPRSSRSKLDSPVSSSKRSEAATSGHACCRAVPSAGHQSCDAVIERIHVKSCTNGGSMQGRDSSPREAKLLRHGDREHRARGPSSADSPTLQQPRIQGSASPRWQQPRIQGSKSPRPQTSPAHQVQSEKKSLKHAQVRKTARNILIDVEDRRDCKGGPQSPGFGLELPCKEITNFPEDQLQIRSRSHKPDASSQRLRCKDSLESIPEPSPRQAATTQHNINAESEFAFVRDILVTSGFHTHGGRNLTRWYSPSQPLSHHLFLKVDSSHSRFHSSSRSSHHRRMIFDVINEVLIAQLEAASLAPGAPCFGLPVIGSGNSGSSGRRFVEDVWRKVQKAMGMQGKGLQALVAEELPTSCRWLSVQRYVDRCCLQVEAAIWNDLVEEFVAGYGAVRLSKEEIEK